MASRPSGRVPRAKCGHRALRRPRHRTMNPVRVSSSMAGSSSDRCDGTTRPGSNLLPTTNSTSEDATYAFSNPPARAAQHARTMRSPTAPRSHTDRARSFCNSSARSRCSQFPTRPRSPPIWPIEWSRCSSTVAGRSNTFGPPYRPMKPPSGRTRPNRTDSDRSDFWIAPPHEPTLRDATTSALLTCVNPAHKSNRSRGGKTAPLALL